MLLRGNPSLESRCPRLWSALVAPALLAFAVLAAGIDFQADAAPVTEPDKKEAPKNVDPKPVPAVPGLPDFPDLENLLPPNLPLAPEQFKEFQEEMKRARDQARKAMEDLRQPGRLGVLGLANRSEARLGAQVMKPGETLVDQLDLPVNQGLVLVSVENNSAAARAGLKSHDVLLELAGKPVSNNPADLIAQIKEIKANEAIEAVVLRKGKKETVKNLILPEAKVARPMGVVPFQFKPPFQIVPGNGENTILQVIRNGETFTTNCSENGVTMRLTGTVAEGKGTLTGATITEKGVTTKYESLDKIPEAHQARVKELVKMSATGQVKVDR